MTAKNSDKENVLLFILCLCYFMLFLNIYSDFFSDLMSMHWEKIFDGDQKRRLGQTVL